MNHLSPPFISIILITAFTSNFVLTIQNICPLPQVRQLFPLPKEYDNSNVFLKVLSPFQMTPALLLETVNSKETGSWISLRSNMEGLRDANPMKFLFSHSKGM
jgi:hypothetical protein